MKSTKRRVVINRKVLSLDEEIFERGREQGIQEGIGVGRQQSDKINEGIISNQVKEIRSLKSGIQRLEAELSTYKKDNYNYRELNVHHAVPVATSNNSAVEISDRFKEMSRSLNQATINVYGFNNVGSMPVDNSMTRTFLDKILGRGKK